VHSSTVCLSPTFLFFTSNQHLQTHTFANKDQQPSSSATRPTLFSRTFPSQAMQGSNQTNARVKDDVDALSRRFLECFVAKRPELDEEMLPKSGHFERQHFIAGVYERVIATLEHYARLDFYSPVLPQYCLYGLANNILLYSRVFGLEEAKKARDRITRLVCRYIEVSMRAPLTGLLEKL
jgi:hypothetical protein